MTPNHLYSYTSDPQRLMALMIGREGRNQSRLFRIACGKVVINRCKYHGQGFKPDIQGNILHPGAFSSFNPDPNPKGNGNWFPDEESSLWSELMIEARQVLTGTDDPSNGAHFYFTPPVTQVPHDWPPVSLTAKIDVGSFYKITAKGV